MNEIRTIRILSPPASHVRPRQRKRHAAARLLSSGYYVRHERLYRIWNLCLVVPVIILCLPVMGVIALLLLVTQPLPITHWGTRLGKDQVPFSMYKFRTLRKEAVAITQTCGLPARSNMETPLGKFLRNSRLDELPQLINVLKGDMNLLGPRPARLELAQELIPNLPGYTARFAVKPGLFGYTQACMTHDTPRHMRSKYNAYLVKQPACIWKEPFILTAMVWGALRQAGVRFFAWGRLVIKTRSVSDRRQVGRSSPGNASVYIRDAAGVRLCGRLLNINDEAFVMHTEEKLREGQHTFVLKRELPRRGQSRRATCVGTEQCRLQRGGKRQACEQEDPAGGYTYLVSYKTVSALNWYIVDRYFLGNAILA